MPRATRVLTVVLVAAALLLAVPAAADHQPYTTPPFQKVAPYEHVDLADAFAPWHRIAGRTLFVVSTDNPFVTWNVGTPSSYVELSPRRCVVNLASSHASNLSVIQHELGHCLGFGDHIKVPDPYGRENEKVCNDPSHQNYSPYQGVMSYCDFNTRNEWWGNDDVVMMRAATFGPGEWAREAWEKAQAKGILTSSSDPRSTITKQELMVFFDRLGLLD